MKDLIIADVHLGSPLFEKSNQLYELITSCEYNKIIILGDFFDVWHEQLGVMLCEYYGIIEVIKNKGSDVFYVPGNHSPENEVLEEIFPEATIVDELDYKGYRIMHGHQFDDMITQYSLLAKFFFVFQWLFERIGINLKACCRELSSSVSSKIGKGYYKDLTDAIEQEAVDTYKDTHKGIIMGHTHRPMLSTYYNFIYVNCGDWIHSKKYVELLYDDNGENAVPSLISLGDDK